MDLSLKYNIKALLTQSITLLYSFKNKKITNAFQKNMLKM